MDDALAAPKRSMFYHMRKRPRTFQTSSSPATPARCCRLLELPAELREQIWIHVVTEWKSLKAEHDLHLNHEYQNGPGSSTASPAISTPLLQRTPIRLDRFNRPLPPAITRVSRQLRHETLHLYYSENVWELWRPLFWIHDWSMSTLIDWLTTLGPRTRWLTDVVLLYKHESELEHSMNEALADLGLELGDGVVKSRQELSEYEMSYEALGLPKHFGKRRRRDF